MDAKHNVQSIPRFLPTILLLAFDDRRSLNPHLMLWVLIYTVGVAAVTTALVIPVVLLLVRAYLDIDYKPVPPAPCTCDAPRLSPPSLSTLSPADTLYRPVSVLADLFVDEFISSWYSAYVPDPAAFPAHVRAVLFSCVAQVLNQFRNLPWTTLIRQYIAIVHDSITSGPAVQLHPGCCDVPQHCRLVAQRILTKISPLDPLVTALSAEMLGACVLQPLLEFLQPDCINAILVRWCQTPPALKCASVSKQVIAEKSASDVYHGHPEATDVTSFEVSAVVAAPISLWQVDIVKAMLQFDPKPFVTYCIDIRYGDSCWTIARRYTEFVGLHKQLSKLPTFDGRLPKKNLRDKFKRWFIEQRRLDLDRYLKRIVACEACLDTSAWFEWLTPRSFDMSLSNLSPAPSCATMMEHEDVRERSDRSEPKRVETRTEDQSAVLQLLLRDALALFKAVLQADDVDDVSLRTWTGAKIAFGSVQRTLLLRWRDCLSKDTAMDDALAAILSWITASIWPNGHQPSSSTPCTPPVLRSETERALVSVIPRSFTILIGQKATTRLVRNVVTIANSQTLLTHIAFRILDATIQMMEAPR